MNAVTDANNQSALSPAATFGTIVAVMVCLLYFIIVSLAWTWWYARKRPKHKISRYAPYDETVRVNASESTEYHNYGEHVSA